MEGNIYDLRGNFIGTTDGDGAEGGAAVGANESDSQIMGADGEQFGEADEYWEALTKLSELLIGTLLNIYRF